MSQLILEAAGPELNEMLRHRQSDDRRTNATPRSRHYPMLGALLALGAPSGLLLFRIFASGKFPTLSWTFNELSTYSLTYGYVMVSTLLLLVISGYLLGRKSDFLRTLSDTDTLTGIFNRRLFNDRLKDEMERSARYRMPLSIMSVDLDHLKCINDSLGHKAGDAALMAVATSLSDNARTSDVVARIGGDEFAVLFPQTTAITAVKQARRFVKALARKRGIWGCSLSASVGVAEFDPTVELPGPDFLLAADTALYEAKAAGGGQTIMAKSQ